MHIDMTKILDVCSAATLKMIEKNLIAYIIIII